MAQHAAAHISGLAFNLKRVPNAYAVPRGGIPAAYLIANFVEMCLVSTPDEADVFIDDLLDSGGTRDQYEQLYPGKHFVVLYNKQAMSNNNWIVFPWEAKEEQSEDDSIVGTITNRLRAAKVPFKANDSIHEHLLPGEMVQVEAEVALRAQRLLEALLIDTAYDHNTRETGARVAKMYCREIFAGRYCPPPTITEFPNAKNLDEVYVTGPITIRSACSHHLCPIIGKAWVGILPGERVVGLSKFNRVIEWIASRPQIQEELVVQIADELETALEPKGIAVVIQATHFCMTWRGVKEAGGVMTTSVMRGVFRDKPEARAEFLALIPKA